MPHYEIMNGTLGLQVHEVAHGLIPGRGRDATGYRLTPQGEDRVDCAAEFYKDNNLRDRDGVIVVTGYRSVKDQAGADWKPEDSPFDEYELFKGIPEADLMQRRLILKGISASRIPIERHAVDTVTNFARTEAEGYFPDDRPVAIFAQEKHLERIIDIIAPRTLRRDYLGIVVPCTVTPDIDTAQQRLASLLELLFVHPDTKDMVRKVERNSKVIWGIAELLNLI